MMITQFDHSFTRLPVGEAVGGGEDVAVGDEASAAELAPGDLPLVYGHLR